MVASSVEPCVPCVKDFVLPFEEKLWEMIWPEKK
jgi:hypothetical protein